MSSNEVIDLELTGVRFYSMRDESAFFSWLQGLDCVKKVNGRGLALHVAVVASALDEEMLREFLALFNRYAIDMRQLALFDREEFAEWFRDPKAYWFNSVFG